MPGTPARTAARSGGQEWSQARSPREGKAVNDLAERGQLAAGRARPCGHMPFMDVDGDADIPLMDGDGLIAGDAPLPLAEGVGMLMFMGEPPTPMLWWTATHQVQTSPCTGPAT